MKSILAVLAAAAVLSVATPNLKADTVSAGIDLGLGAGLQAVVLTPIANGFTYTYTHTSLSLLSGSLLNSSTSVFTATYLDVTGLLGVLTVTDVCTNITVLGTPVPCQAFAFSFTNVSLPIANVDVAIGAAIDLSLNVINLGGSNTTPFNLLGVNVQGGTGTINYTPPPTGPSPVPEPGTLGMMATGLIGAAGAIRRKFNA